MTRRLPSPPSRPPPARGQWSYFYFAVIYTADVLLTTTTQPWGLYFVHGGRRVDLVVTIVVSVVAFFWMLPQIPIPDNYVRYANVVRIMKLVTILPNLSPDIAFVMHALGSVFRGAVNVIGQLFIWTAFWVVLAGQLFGGTVYQTNPLLAGTTYQSAPARGARPPPRHAPTTARHLGRRPARATAAASPPPHATAAPLAACAPRARRAGTASYYEVLNFNDFFMGFIPFIVPLVSAGPNQDFILGIGAAADMMTASKVVFITYYYTTQLLVLNVFVSYVVSAYTMYHEAYYGAGMSASGQIVDGLDADQREKIRSLYAHLPEEPGWTVIPSGRQNADVLLRRLFRDDIIQATEDASREEVMPSPSRKSAPARRNGNQPGAKAKGKAPASEAPSSSSSSR